MVNTQLNPERRSEVRQSALRHLIVQWAKGLLQKPLGGVVIGLMGIIGIIGFLGILRIIGFMGTIIFFRNKVLRLQETRPGTLNPIAGTYYLGKAITPGPLKSANMSYLESQGT